MRPWVPHKAEIWLAPWLIWGCLVLAPNPSYPDQLHSPGKLAWLSILFAGIVTSVPHPQHQLTIFHSAPPPSSECTSFLPGPPGQPARPVLLRLHFLSLWFLICACPLVQGEIKVSLKAASPPEAASSVPLLSHSLAWPDKGLDPSTCHFLCVESIFTKVYLADIAGSANFILVNYFDECP